MSDDTFARLAALLEPLDPGAFFADHWERAPLHLRAEGRRARPLLTEAALLDALVAGGAPPAGLMVFPEHFDRAVPDAAALLADRGALAAYVAAGHPIVWNRARGVFPEVDAVTAMLAEAFGAHVWPNVYATGDAGTPFDMHFDCHEVIAVHCAGEKAWTISEVRVDRPLDAGAMAPTVRAVMAARRDEAIARPRLQCSVAPGDVVYIPRGQFHNARTPSGRSLHVTFGVRLLTGLDVAELLVGLTLGDPALREYLPPAAADPGGDRARAQLADIRARLAALLLDDGLDAAVEELRAHGVRRSRST